MQPLDSYREKGFFGVRVFELFDDRIVIGRARFFSHVPKVIVPLAKLEPTVTTQAFEEPTRVVGVVTFFVSAICALSRDKYPPIYKNFGFWVWSFFALISFALVIRSFYRIESVVFHTSSGARLIIARMGPDVGRFQDFTERILSQIKLCRAGEADSP